MTIEDNKDDKLSSADKERLLLNKRVDAALQRRMNMSKDDIMEEDVNERLFGCVLGTNGIKQTHSS